MIFSWGDKMKIVQKNSLLIVYIAAAVLSLSLYAALPPSSADKITKETFVEKNIDFYNQPFSDNPIKFAQQVETFVDKAEGEYNIIQQLAIPGFQSKQQLEIFKNSCTEIIEELTFLLPLLQNSSASSYYYDVLGRSFAASGSSLEKFTKNPHVNKWFKTPKDVYTFLSNLPNLNSQNSKWENLTQTDLKKNLKEYIDQLAKISNKQEHQENILRFLREIDSFLRTKFGKLQYDDFIAGKLYEAEARHFISNNEMRNDFLKRVENLYDKFIELRFRLDQMIQNPPAPPAIKYTTGFYTIKNQKAGNQENEDRSYINTTKNYLFAGVYDGHGGADAASFINNNLGSNILNRLSAGEQDIKKIFIQETDAIENVLRGKPVGYVASWFTSAEPVKGGSTAIMTLIDKQKMLAYTANIGDSRAILIRNVTINNKTEISAIPLSIDQKPDTPTEKEYIEAHGGKVTGTIGRDQTGKNIEYPAGEVINGIRVPARVNFNLAMSRSLGDIKFKQSVGDGNAIRHTPEIIQATLQPTDTAIVLACDGLWDVMQNEEVAITVDSLFEKNKSVQDIAKDLAEMARLYKSKDDITVIVIGINR